MAYGTYQTRNPKAVHSPVRSVPLFKEPTRILGHSDQFKAEWAMKLALRDLPRAEEYFVFARANLGDANRSKPALRRARQSKAMRLLNQARAELRRARKALVVAQVAMLAFGDAA